MKFALLSGAYKNSGDFLIVKRSKELLNFVYPNCTIKDFERRMELSNSIDEINQCDAIIIAGGPSYIHNVYPKIIPLVSNLSSIKPKIFTLGNGWYGNDAKNSTIYKYKFTKESNKLFARITNDGGALSCRDWETVKVLNNNGHLNTKMTGCPAWYNLNYINSGSLRNKVEKNQIKKICVSDPGNIKNYNLAIDLVKYLKNNFDNCEIKFIFHRGINYDQNTNIKLGEKLFDLKSTIEELGVECLDISYGSDGFKIYDECNLHIGFRVHAHIYNLSCRNVSILIEEDSRGAGVNNALGLQNIIAYDYMINYGNDLYMKIHKKLYNCRNKYFLNNVNDYFDQLFYTNFTDYKNAFEKMQISYNVMIEHINSFKKFDI